MPKQKGFTDPTAFRQSLEDRIRTIAAEDSVPAARVRRLVAFDRFLARLIKAKQDAWILKGGYAMELRFSRARSTTDIDLSYRIGSPTELDLLDELQNAAAIDLNDFFSYIVEPTQFHIQGAPYGGIRFPVVANMAGRNFERFSVDVAVADPPEKPEEELTGRSWLEFAGIKNLAVPAISGEQQLAEKLHAFTVPRNAPNSRVRDLIDMVLLIGSGKLDPRKVMESLTTTFDRRDTHSLPISLDPPPPDWSRPYLELANECGMNPNLTAAFDLVRMYFDDLRTRFDESVLGSL